MTRSGTRPSLATFLDRRMPRILLLGAISGFPWVLIGSALSLWLKDEGMSRSTIGWATLIFSVYAFNFLWAPLIDRIRLPWLTERIGHRKAWIVTLQVVILAMLLQWSTLSPAESLTWVIACGLVIAIASASQDITIDALRIEQVDRGESAAMAAGAAVAVIGWWTGYKLGGLLLLLLDDALEQRGFTQHWQISFVAMAALVVGMNLLLLLIPEAPWRERRDRQLADEQLIADRLAGTAKTIDASTARPNVAVRIAAWFASTLASPITSFFRQNGLQLALSILAFVFLFKIGEAFVGRMSIVFYDDIGFSKSDIGLYSKGLGWVTTVVFTLIGGWFVVTRGVVGALFLAGLAMAATNLLFSLLAWQEVPATWLFALAVLVDDVTAAIATVTFVTFISLLVDRTYTATQYALLASLATAGRTVMAASSGAVVDGLNGDWGLFFVITAIMVVPSLLVLLYLRKRLPFTRSSPSMLRLDDAADTPPAPAPAPERS